MCIVVTWFFLFYVGAQMAGAGKMLFTTFEIPPTIGILIATAIIIFIAFGGGFISVVWTDMIQSVMMVFTLVAVSIVALFYIFANDLYFSKLLTDATSTHTEWFGCIFA